MEKSDKKGRDIVLLHDIRSRENVGSIFRTADAAGISEIYLTGYTPAPIDRFGRQEKKIAKTALGAEKSIPWKSVEDIEALLTELRTEGFQIIAVEQAERAVDYREVKLSQKNVFIFGNEVTGLPESVLEMADIVAEIKMRGKKESLNVAVAAGVALFGILSV